MNKEILFLFIFALIANIISAQPSFEFNTGILKGTANELCYNATQSGIYIAQSEYVLVSPKTKKEFGRAGNEYFGKKIGIAPLVNGLLTLPSQLAEPWKGEELLVLFDTLQPKLHKVSIRRVSGGALEIVNFTLDTAINSIVVNLDKPSFAPTTATPISAYLVYFVRDNKADSLVLLPNVKKVKVDWTDKMQPKLLDAQLPPIDFVGGILFSELIEVGSVKYAPIAVFKHTGIDWILEYLTSVKTQIAEKTQVIENPKNLIKDTDLTPLPTKSEEKRKEEFKT